MFRSMGFVRGDKVAINMMNRPEYTCILLGLSKIGVADLVLSFQKASNGMCVVLALTTSVTGTIVRLY